MIRFEDAERVFRSLAGEGDSLRVHRSEDDGVAVVRGVVAPPNLSSDVGAMWTSVKDGAQGYAATQDLSVDGLRAARDKAHEWCEISRANRAFAHLPPGAPNGEYGVTVQQPWSEVTRAERLDVVQGAAQRLSADSRVVNWHAALHSLSTTLSLFTAEGGAVRQAFDYLFPSLAVTVHDRGESETRTFKGGALGRQGGLETLASVGFAEAPPELLADALALLYAPHCPNETTTVLLAPDQMILQLHESVGHPLELDRILGDERNYAGTSFVTPEMFGTYQYGSALLNVTFDPTVAGELASYGFDDAGDAAQRAYLIRDGQLLRPLGSAASQHRAGLPGVANARSQNWNRPPIDRMANLNIEPGQSSFVDLVQGIENGVFMRTNSSWSIDDSRNKFQFGCEWAQRIVNGELTEVLRKPNYRGQSATFWRSLVGVGNADTWEILGTPHCGKGEPNQVIRVGHASPTCSFENVEVFGGV
ncbi:MAG: TldD/PmbA family protein [Gammaproteobacteria bacterium]|nr:TldD/PmbA family protein [Gammaproteobacteria bacterium]